MIHVEDKLAEIVQSTSRGRDGNLFGFGSFTRLNKVGLRRYKVAAGQPTQHDPNGVLPTFGPDNTVQAVNLEQLWVCTRKINKRAMGYELLARNKGPCQKVMSG